MHVLTFHIFIIICRTSFFTDDSFKDSWKVSQIKQIRDDNAYLNNCDIQRAFGDISENYRAFLRRK